VDWTLDKSRPICPQIAELISVAIARGDFTANEKLPSVREIALSAAVNPNTVQKSLEELESRGVIRSVRCSGWYVCEDTEGARGQVCALRRSKTEAYLSEMAQLGCDAAEIIKQLNECMGGKQ
jgi:DNA-binding transcriptional regulator YhcF (GntR family)